MLRVTFVVNAISCVRGITFDVTRWTYGKKSATPRHRLPYNNGLLTVATPSSLRLTIVELQIELSYPDKRHGRSWPFQSNFVKHSCFNPSLFSSSFKRSGRSMKQPLLQFIDVQWKQSFKLELSLATSSVYQTLPRC